MVEDYISDIPRSARGKKYVTNRNSIKLITWEN